MEDYLGKWLVILETMHNENTYKLAWGRALVELINERDLENGAEEVVLNFVEIGHKMMSYYWNQRCYFNLRQGPKNSPPIIEQETTRCIQWYQCVVGSNLPEWFYKAEVVLKEDDRIKFHETLNKIASALKPDVSHRFMVSKRETIELYQLDKKKGTVTFDREKAKTIKKNSKLLMSLITIRWVELLERFNHSPKILSKVRGSLNKNIKRSSLAKFKKILIANTEEIRDFYTGELLGEKEATVDHVIPWSFMYSDDIWNLVLTSRSNNSRKYNHKPTEQEIERLVARNELLEKKLKPSKYQKELQLAREENFVHKFYNDFIN